MTIGTTSPEVENRRRKLVTVVNTLRTRGASTCQESCIVDSRKGDRYTYRSSLDTLHRLFGLSQISSLLSGAAKDDEPGTRSLVIELCIQDFS